MSRFGDILRKSLHTAPSSLGFRPSAATKPRMVLVAALNELPDDFGLWVEGADAVIVGAGLKVKEIKASAKVIQAPWGIWLNGSSQAARQAEAAGADFVAFEPDKTGLDILASEKLGKIISVDASIENALLYSINELPVEAVYLKREPRGAVTWLELMQFRRLADLIAKPMLVPVAPDTSPAHLKALWEAGVDGVLITALAAGELAEIRSGMDEMALPARKKWLRARPLVPVMSPVPSLTQREEEEEEDEEE